MAEPSVDPATTEMPKTKEKLDELTKAASLQYSLKNFTAAADHYADAVEIQAELNGEMAPENAELLFYYGRALYKVAVAKSDVLGNKVAQEDKKKPKAEKQKKESGEGSSAPANGAKPEKEEEETVASKPYFQLTGDENWTDSEDEDEEGGEGQEEEQDDFGNAYEVFEMARVLYTKQLEALGTGEETSKGKGKAELTPSARAIKEKLADCHGFLVEISLENERFHDAIPDARASLELQEELNSFDHENVTEGHYSLSLALEFASVTKVREQQTGQNTEESTEQQEDVIDYELRKEAAKHTEIAIQSLEARLKKEEVALASDTLTSEQKKEKATIVEDKKSMLEDLKNRLTDLQADPAKQQFDNIDQTVFQGLLGGLMGTDAATQKAKLAEATASANDISGLIKTKKKEKVPAGTASSSDASSKRKLEVDDDGMNGKRAKTEEAQ